MVILGGFLSSVVPPGLAECCLQSSSSLFVPLLKLKIFFCNPLNAVKQFCKIVGYSLGWLLLPVEGT